MTHRDHAAAAPARRSTPQRAAIVAVLRVAGRPLTPGEVLQAAKANVPGLGIATVYRNLKALHADGELDAVDLPGEDGRRYELAELRHHHHFVCQRCGRAFDIDVCPGDLSRILPAGFVLERHDLVLYGSCVTCG